MNSTEEKQRPIHISQGWSYKEKVWRFILDNLYAKSFLYKGLQIILYVEILYCHLLGRLSDYIYLLCDVVTYLPTDRWFPISVIFM